MTQTIDRIRGNASPEATARYAARFSKAAPGHFRKFFDLVIGSIGMGTYLGNPDYETDEAYTDAAADAVQRGCNVIDSAANYRFQRSERSIGKALRRLITKGFTRDEIVLCTKGGFIPFDGDVPDHAPTYFTETFIKPGVATPADLVGGMHCMTPAFLAHQLECSRANFGIDTIDVYYIHNPEEQLKSVPRDEFYARSRKAFEMLERAADEGKISRYGCATWKAFRSPPDAPEHVSLEKLVHIAREISGDRNRFKVIQLPFNLRMHEALLANTQDVGAHRLTALQAAEELGLAVFASASIHQGHLTHDLPPVLNKYFGNLSIDAQRAIQFVRSAPAISASLVGMSSMNHVAENLALVGTPPLTAQEFTALVSGR